MAIQKSKTLPSGVSGDYWKIAGISVDKLALTVTYTITLFLDMAHGRPAESAGLGVYKLYQFDSNVSELQGNLTALGYTNIAAKAATMVTPLGNPKGALVQFDSDLAGGTAV